MFKMAGRPRKPVDKKMPDFRVTSIGKDEADDLKKVKAQALKAIEETKKNDKDWYDKELDKNLKKQ